MIRRNRMALFVASLATVLVATMACSSATPTAKPTAAPAGAAAAAPSAAPAAPAPTSAAAAAQPATDWPTKPITLIVPWPAGGDTDVPMRVVADYMTKELGQPVVVKDVEGGAGTTGSRQAKDAKPDGYTLLSIHEHVFINKALGLVPYDWDAFEPVAFLISSPEFMLTEASQPWNNMKDVIADAKKRPGEITAGVTFGSTAQMHIEMLQYKAGVKFKEVGYDGTAQRVTAVLGKHLDIGASPLSSAIAQWKAKRVKVLGFASDKRDPRLPDVATYKEQGIDMTWGTDRGLVAPKGTPLPIILKIEAAMKKVSENPEFKKKIEDEMGSVVNFMPHDQYAKYLAQSDAEIQKVIKDTGMTAKQ